MSLETHIRAYRPEDLPAILAIFNDAIVNTTAIWVDEVVDLENRRAWVAAREAAGYPVLIAEIDGQVAGYASFGDFRAFPGYRRTVEHSIYVDARFRRRGIADALLTALEAPAIACGKHVILGGIGADNVASLALHEKHGYVEVARMPEVGLKFGAWQTLVFMQKVLAS
jgi:phosphinothricin acetyltransferase